MYKSHISIGQVKRLALDEQEYLKAWWRPEIGDWYYDPRFNFPCIVPQEADLDYYRGGFVPLLNEGQMIRLIGSTLRPKIFKVTKTQQRYYRNRHNPSVNLPVGWWVVWPRKPHKNAWQHKFHAKNLLIDALWEATIEVLKIKVVV